MDFYIEEDNISGFDSGGDYRFGTEIKDDDDNLN